MVCSVELNLTQCRFCLVHQRRPKMFQPIDLARVFQLDSIGLSAFGPPVGAAQGGGVPRRGKSAGAMEAVAPLRVTR